MIIGHLWWILTDVPPQPNSLPMNVPVSCFMLKHLAKKRVSSAASKVVVFHWCLRSHIHYADCATVQKLARVNLNRVFLPFCLSLARSLSCRFAGKLTGTVGISLIRSCESLIRWRGILLRWKRHSYACRWPALIWASSHWHSKHRAEFTFCININTFRMLGFS